MANGIYALRRSKVKRIWLLCDTVCARLAFTMGNG